MTSYDAIVIGLGAMGSATLWQLARRGLKVLGIERFEIPHDRGSSHGLTRIIRLAYYEHPSYVPLMRRAYALWRELEGLAGEPLLHITGSLDAGPSESQVFAGSLASCLEHGLPHEVLTSADLRRRFPAYHLPPETMALFQPEGGFLVPERCIVAQVALARAHGAEVHTGERVEGWAPRGDGVEVVTDGGRYQAARLIVAAGAWEATLLPRLDGLAVPERQVLVWLQPQEPAAFAPERFPVFNLTVDEGRFYGFPVWGHPGFKLGKYRHRHEVVDPDEVDRRVYPEDEALLRDCAARYFPAGAGTTLQSTVCLFTNTPDGHFVIDQHPEAPQVVIVSPCSGHGFKFASVVGEIAADLAQHGETEHEIGLFRLARLQGAIALDDPFGQRRRDDATI